MAKKDYLNKNINFFKEGAPFIYKTLIENIPLYKDVKITKINGNPLNFILQNAQSQCYLNSLKYIEKQIQKRISEIDDDIELLIVYGLECGYIVEKIITEKPNIKHIIIVEPCLQLFKQVIENRDISVLFKRSISISIILNQNSHVSAQMASHIIDQNRRLKMQQLAHTTYLTIFEDYFKEFTEFTLNLINSKMVNICTNYEVLHRYTINVMRNQKCNYHDAEELFRELKKLNCPAIIVSAGPSLNKNIKQLLEYKNKAFIVAVGTAIRILHENGIEPHLRVAVDGFPSESIFKNIDTEKVPLLYCDKIHWEVLENYIGTKYRMILDMDNLTHYFSPKEYSVQMPVRSGYSVANITLDLLSQIGFKKIILVGQDLCYTKEKLYADGALDNEKLNMTGDTYTQVQDIYGNEVYTSIGFISMKTLFEHIIQEYPGTKIVNATEGGIPIFGAENMTLIEATSLLETDELLRKIGDFFNVSTDNSYSKTTDYSKFFQELEAIFSINNQQIKYFKSVTENVGENLKINKIQDYEGFENRLRSFRDEFNLIELYKTVIYPSLVGVVSNLYEFYSYDGDERDLKIEALYNGALAETTQIQRFILLLKELKEELNY